MRPNAQSDCYETAIEPQSERGGQGPSSSPYKPRRGFPVPASAPGQSCQGSEESTTQATAEEDWISPFTLPHLPSLKPSRGDSNPRSPSPQHRKSSSSVYYAAAWGSPVTPETRRSTAPFRSPNRRERSPGDLAESPHSERGNWLSDSEGSVRSSPWPKKADNSIEDWLGLEGEDQADGAARTPTLGSFIESRYSITSSAGIAQPGLGHRAQDSTATIKQVDYWRLSAAKTLPNDNGTGEMASLQSANGYTEHIPKSNPAPDIDKPLPPGPEQVDRVSDMSISGTRPPLRPQMSGFQSFQRPRKKVVWKGKSCMIALPLEDGRGSDGAQLLTPADVQARLDQWEREGHNTTGFVLGDMLDGNPSTLTGGQSRKIHPDPFDMLADRRSHGYKVSIPDKAEWDAWMELIKEEKLRALGVTTSDSEPPPSTRSPFSSTMSRASSQYPNLPFSPPQPPSSVGSGYLLPNGHMFSPHINPATGAGPHVPSKASPSSQIVGLPGPIHRYKQSVAYPPMEACMTSPGNYPMQRPTPPALRQRSPPHYFVQRHSSVSPAAVGGMQSLGEVLSPVSPLLPEIYGGPSQPSVMLDRMRRQQQDLQAQMLHQQQQQIMLSQSRLGNGPYGPSDPEKQFLARVEIAHPTPLPHQRNLSEALQREIDEAETSLERETWGNGRVDEPNGNSPQANSSHLETPIEPRMGAQNCSFDAPVIPRITEIADLPEIEPPASLRISTVPSAQIHSPLQRTEPLESNSSRPISISMAHKVKSSVSKLNVDAKEFKFDPKAAFLSSNFQFGSSAFQPTMPSAQLNAAAPEFQPLAAMPNRPSANKFDFSSVTFDVDAPVFTALGTVSSQFGSSVTSESDDRGSVTNKIFGKIIIDPSLKATRRSSKALPIVKPAIEESDLEERDKVEDDEAGRPAPSLARSKRVRRHGSDGDQEAVYAPHNEQTTPEQEAENAEPPTTSPADQVTLASADTDKQSSPDKWEPFKFKDEMDASIFNSGRPPHFTRPVLTSTSSVEVDSPAATRREIGHQMKPSLSASAPPFVPLSAQQVVTVPRLTHEPVKPRRSMGLEASRFAVTSSPPASPPLPTSSADADKLCEEKGITGAAGDVCEPRHELNNSRILEEIVARGHMSDAEKSMPVHEIGGSGFSYAADAVFEPRPDLRNSRILEEIVSEAHLSDAERSVPISEIDEGSVRSIPESTSISKTLDHFCEPMPTYEEIDEVMKQLENDPDLGVERLNTPPVRSSPGPTPQLRPFPNIRSDAPSPSPRRMQTDCVLQDNTPRKSQMLFGESNPGPEFPVRRLNGQNDGEISDWNAEMSSPDAQKVQSRAQFFDAHVVELVGGILDNRVGPMETTLKTIQHSLAVMATRPTSSRRERKSLSTDNNESDADDEDDEEGQDVVARYQTMSPVSRKDQRPDRIKTAVQEALATHNAQKMEVQRSDLSGLPDMLAEMTRLARQLAPESRQAELKAVVEDVIATHPRLRGHRVQQSHDLSASEEKNKLQISGLESMLKIANERAEQEARSRRNAEDDLADALRQLKYAEEEAAHHRESSEEAERTLLAYHREKESLANLEETVSQLSLKNAALETTLEEYRLSSDQWREDIRDERIKTKELRHTIHSLKRHLDDNVESKQALRGKIERLQDNLAAVVKDIAYDQALSRKQELDFATRNEHLQSILDHEVRKREKCELELDELEKEHRQNVQFRDRCTHLQTENSRLEQAMAMLSQECKEARDVAFHSQRELQDARDSAEKQVRQAISALEADLKLADSQASIIRADLEAQLARLQDSLEHAELDATNAKAKYDSMLEETLEANGRSLQQVIEEKEAALQSQQSAHEKKLNDLRERHTRALHNSSDDRHRLEHHLNEKLALSEDQVQHLESKVTDLQERLEITKSAARAAVEAATSKGISLPTPAPSVVASPPQSTTASMALVKGSDIPEKISPQALRESIMVLQDQLQNREQKIEQLDAELAQVDKEAPAKIQDRDTEINWLRELLGVRIDDLEEIIKTLSQKDYDREAVRDAAIRLRANLQMEQQEKERAASNGSNRFPSIASLSNLTQSPRAFPMAAAAAWGNWRKARDSSLGALTDLTNLGNQTPSRSTFGGSPQSFLAGLVTPPSTNQRQVVPTMDNAIAPPTMMSLGGSSRKIRGEARPLRAYNAQARSLTARQMEKQPISTAQGSSQQRSVHSEPPSTPPLMRMESYDGDVDLQSISGDLDADASPIGDKENMPSGDNFTNEGGAPIRS